MVSPSTPSISARRSYLQVSINYERFRPTGEATIRVRRPQDLYPALYALKNASISHYFLHFKPTHDIVPIRPRTRGAKGRQEAIQRGLITGDGPDAGIAERGKSVVIWGLPPRVRLDKLREFLNNGRLSSEPTLAVVDPCVYPAVSTPSSAIESSTDHLTGILPLLEYWCKPRAFRMPIVLYEISIVHSILQRLLEKRTRSEHKWYIDTVDMRHGPTPIWVLVTSKTEPPPSMARSSSDSVKKKVRR